MNWDMFKAILIQSGEDIQVKQEETRKKEWKILTLMTKGDNTSSVAS